MRGYADIDVGLAPRNLSTTSALQLLNPQAHQARIQAQAQMLRYGYQEPPTGYRSTSEAPRCSWCGRRSPERVHGSCVSCGGPEE